MGDFAYLSNKYGLSAENADELVERILESDVKFAKSEAEKISLNKGRDVHLIRLTKEKPAKVFEVELNTQLSESILFSGFNYLDSPDYRSPGSWFVDRGFTVRSKDFGSYWLQVAFAESGPVNITRSEVIEYLKLIGLPFDESKIGEFCVTKI
ncbi:hypothetical protein ACTNIH_004646 [Vibrio parahaemolyticus]|uniref:hypothetical protein n=1 Tax=Vibrio TaxID=662 RepID=UPI00084AC975|nr:MULTISPECIES: hypothetical protein [Vibrio]EGQ9707358.1 hypothetical protein [Vibrio parahaemolyticus]EGR1690036.1 hypothetical protein [Vibrio parahaemolyticus]EHK9054827.1 hypothetical protein [Vibrio vulnificus]EHU9469735.1 hypothetical protein [Vibrio parahaemolyticus]EJG0980521.1 hypothetical protein [Vibrio parahaemolyticus]